MFNGVTVIQLNCSNLSLDVSQPGPNSETAAASTEQPTVATAHGHSHTAVSRIKSFFGRKGDV